MATFSASGTSLSPTKIEVQARQFTLTIDEPPNLGGEDHGANPVEYVLGALLGCLNVVIQMVAKEKGIEYRSLKLTAEGDLNPAKLMGEDVTTRPGFQEIRVAVELDTDADEQAVAELLSEAESRCPVSDNLANATPVRISAAARA
ncbi:OsmC family protein [Brachybacterium sp. Marseille-Q7125]|uniref:OsmC family protein n=1 Tax=Brachybacterium sp. Marseille-Q7125 TaxID=2932815 RepID=UPI001FF323C7